MDKLEYDLVLMRCQDNESDVVDGLISGKWKINSVYVEDEVMNVSGEGNWMEFNCNGTYEISLDHEEQIGTWNLDSENHISLDLEESNVSAISKEHLSFSISGYTLDLTK